MSRATLRIRTGTAEGAARRFAVREERREGGLSCDRAPLTRRSVILETTLSWSHADALLEVDVQNVKTGSNFTL